MGVCFAFDFPPSCFCHVLRRCEANSGILENMSAREQRYNAQEALERIWNDSGDEEDFDGDEKQ